MRNTRIIAATLILAAGLATGTEARTLSEGAVPAELPPASYTGKSYVDSKGCLYVRAGINGILRWVPRVDRQRNLLCGYKPTLSPSEIARAQAAPRSAEANGPEILTLDGPAPAAPSARTPRAAPAATTQPARKPSPSPAPTVYTSGGTPAPATVQRKPSAGPAPTVFTSGEGQIAPVRVEIPPKVAQSLPNVTVPKGYRLVWTDGRAATVRPTGDGAVMVTDITRAPKVPPGYRPAWNDGRLNPLRGLGTPEGEAQTDQVWTRTVPRQLKQPTGRGGVIVGQAQPVTHVSTRSQVATGAPSYVRVGAYTLQADAQKVAQGLSRKTGLPARIGTLRRNGEALPMVLMGPFASAEQAQAALVKVQGAGFGGATVLR